MGFVFPAKQCSSNPRDRRRILGWLLKGLVGPSAWSPPLDHGRNYCCFLCFDNWKTQLWSLSKAFAPSIFGGWDDQPQWMCDHWPMWPQANEPHRYLHSQWGGGQGQPDSWADPAVLRRIKTTCSQRLELRHLGQTLPQLKRRPKCAWFCVNAHL